MRGFTVKELLKDFTSQKVYTGNKAVIQRYMQGFVPQKVQTACKVGI